jgi:DNA-binding PadR family transcriptional regulator
VSDPLPLLSFYILLALYDGPAHGWDVIKRIRQITDGQSDPSSGSLYLAMVRLEQQGLLAEASRPAGAPDDTRRRYYKLTPSGRSVARAEATRLEHLVEQAKRRRVLSQS